MSLFEKFSGSTRVFNYKNVSVDLNSNILKVGLREIPLETPQQSNFMALILQAAAINKNPSVLLLSQILGMPEDARQFALICSGLIGVLEKCPIANDCGNEAGFFEGTIMASDLIKINEDGISLNKPLANAITSSHAINEETLYQINYPDAQPV